jgi:hypothetical protein
MGRYAVFRSPEGGSIIMDTWAEKLNKMRKRVFAWSQELNRYDGGYRLVMITLTYDYNGTLGKAYEWSPNDIRKFMRTVVGHLDKKLIGYAWVGELQDNGHPHYHVLLAVKPYTRIPLPDKAGWWVKGMTRYTSKVRTVFYICSYLKKKYQKDFSLYPKGMRLFAVWMADEVSKKHLRFEGLTRLQKFMVAEHGWGELKFKSEWRKPEWLRPVYVGSAETKSFADYLAEGANSNG